jgi:hypothetical protein
VRDATKKRKLEEEKKQDDVGPSNVKEEEEDTKEPFYGDVDWDGLVCEGGLLLLLCSNIETGMVGLSMFRVIEL